MSRRRGPAALAPLVAVLVLAAACSGSDAGAPAEADAPATTDAPGSTSTSVPAPTTTETPSLDCPGAVDGSPADPGPFEVGRDQQLYVDPTRPTTPSPQSQQPPRADRPIPVVVLYPAQGDPGAAGSFVDGAAPADGRFPLVVFSHGVFASGTERNDALARWVRAGYVVIAPTFPLSSRPSIEVGDLPNQPGDVVFVTETFRSAVQEPTHRLHGRVLSDCLALAGHSLGGATTLLAAFDPCCAGLEPTAVIDVAGVLVQITPGATLDTADPLPTLVVHGARDAVVPYDNSEDAMAQLRGPRWFLTFPDGGHSSMFEPPEVDVLTAATVAFLDAQLKGAPQALDALPELVDASSIATLQVEPAA